MFMTIATLSLKDELIFAFVFIHLSFCRLIGSDGAFEKARVGYSFAYITSALKYPSTPEVHAALDRMYRIFKIIAGKRRIAKYDEGDRRNRGNCSEDAGFDSRLCITAHT